MKAQSTIVIQRPLKIVFQFITDPQQVSLWTPLQQSIPVTPGPMHTGSQFNEVLKFFGRSMKTRAEVKQYEPWTYFAKESTSGRVRFFEYYLLSSIENGTRLSAILEGNIEGMFAFATPFLQTITQQQLSTQLLKLKHTLENELTRPT